MYPCCYELNPAAASESGSSETGRISELFDFGVVHNSRVPKMLPLFPVEYVRNCSTIHYFNSTGTYRNKIVIFWAGSFS